MFSCRRGVGLSALLGLALMGGAAIAEFPEEIEPGMVQIAEVPKQDFKECSGLVVSRQFPGVLWTHNDGRDRRLFAINRRGEKLAEFELNGVFIWDFEDLAIDDQNRLYAADIGNNARVRPRVVVYRLPEPDPADSGAKLRVSDSWYLEFPAGSFDAESIFIWKEHGYLISKTGDDDPAGLYRWPLAAVGESTELEFLGRLDVESPVTGADLTRDGAKLGMVTTDGAYVIELDGSVAGAVGRKPSRLKNKKGQVEGCAFDHDGLLAIAESRELFLFNAPVFIP